MRFLKTIVLGLGKRLFYVRYRDSQTLIIIYAAQ